MASYYNAMTYIPEPDRSKLIEAVLRYGLFDEAPNLPDNLMGFWMLIEPTLRTSVKKYDRNAERKRKSKTDSTSESFPAPKTEDGYSCGESVGDSFGAGKDKDMDMDKDMEMDTRPAGPDSRSRPCKDMDKESSLTTNIDVEAEEGWEDASEEESPRKLPLCTNVISLEDEQERREYWINRLGGR